jgi:hypothetical protein
MEQERYQATVWVTKYALTQGVFTASGHMWTSDSNGKQYFKNGVLFLSPGHWHWTKEEAIEAADQMRTKKIKLLQKQIQKLDKMTFN